MKPSRLVPLLVLLPLANSIAPILVGFLVSLGVSLITSIVKMGIDKLIEHGVEAAEKQEQEEIKKIALKARNKFELTDLERERLIKGILMQEMLVKLYRVDYACDWPVDKPQIGLTFYFDYSRGANLTHHA